MTTDCFDAKELQPGDVVQEVRECDFVEYEAFVKEMASRDEWGDNDDMFDDDGHPLWLKTLKGEFSTPQLIVITREEYLALLTVEGRRMFLENKWVSGPEQVYCRYDVEGDPRRTVARIGHGISIYRQTPGSDELMLVRKSE